MLDSGVMKRLLALSLVFSFCSACGGPDASSTTSPTPSSEGTTTTEPTTSSPTTTAPTTTSEIPPTTTTLCSVDPIPEIATELASRNSEDIDGDGTFDTVITYAVGDADFLRVVLGSGDTLETSFVRFLSPDYVDPVDGHYMLKPVVPAGSSDLDNDGTSEIFVWIGNTKYHRVAGIWRINACALTRVSAEGLSSDFHVGSGPMWAVGFTCQGSGDFEVREAGYQGGEDWEKVFTPFELEGSNLIPLPQTTGSITPSEGLAIAVADCPGVTLDG